MMHTLFSYTVIPATDFERAFEFYHSITEGMVERNPHVPFPMAYFKDKEGNNVGHLFQMNGFNPSGDGVLVYLMPSKPIPAMLADIEAAGGNTIMPETLIAPGRGHWALFRDTEGNKLALHTK